MNICQKCKAYCCKLGGTDFTEKERQKVLEAGYPDYLIKITDNHYETQSKEGICPYLNKDNSCSIYEVRPLACKSFPVYIEEDNKKTEIFLVECPLASSLSEQEIELMKNQAIEIKQILTTAFKDSKLPKSDLKLIERRFNKFKRKYLDTF